MQAALCCVGYVMLRCVALCCVHCVFVIACVVFSFHYVRFRCVARIVLRFHCVALYTIFVVLCSLLYVVLRCAELWYMEKRERITFYV